MRTKARGYRNSARCSCLHSSCSAELCGTADRVVQRKATIAAAIATDPYSSSMIQPGQMPNVVRWNNANCPDDEWRSRDRPHERQQPEKVPRIYDRCTKKRCCHGPCKRVRRPFWGLPSHPDRDKKAGEHGQPNYKLRSCHSLERCKH